MGEDIAAFLKILEHIVTGAGGAEKYRASGRAEAGGGFDRFREIHHTADALALPSRQDNAPQVKFEALLDGLPVLAFRRTGCAEFIRSEENGWVSPDGDIVDYAKGIEFFYRKWQCGELNALRPQIAEEAKRAFDEDEIVKQMISVYTSVLK